MGRPAQASGQLTRREFEMVSLLIEGLADKEIAKLLFVEPNTVAATIYRASKKVGARHRAHLVSTLYRSGRLPVELTGGAA